MERTEHILVVDDDAEIRNLLARFLSDRGLRVSTAANGREMLAELAASSIDLIVLDVMMPGEDGLTLTRNLRANKSNVSIIMLTAMGEDMDRIIGLEMGADDYLAKPFNPRELLARIKAVLRRSHDPAPENTNDVVMFAGWNLDLNARALSNAQGENCDLSGGEFELLQVFVTHPGRVLNRDQLLDMARGRDAQPFDRAIDVQVSRLRKKIEPDAKTPTLIKTVRGGGYIFTPKVEAGASS
ncbi:MAG: DNA-binding response regulator [Rhodospirillaceae bacterium]|nr:MAG: DNA-binding response regulator [Rhodospirillaceae bacterium]